MDTVSSAIYNMTYQTGDSQAKVDALTASVKTNTSALAQQATAEETVTAKRALSASSVDNLISKYSSNARAADQYASVVSTLNAAEAQGIGTASQRAVALDLAAQKLGINTVATVENTTATKGWYNLFGLIPGQMASVNSSTTGGAAAMRGLTNETNAGSAATRDFREAVHAVDAPLKDMGVGIGGLTGLASAARGGIVALGAAVVGVLAAAFENASDALRHLSGDLQALAGNGGSGAFAALKSSADQNSLSLNTLAGTFGNLLIAQQKFESAQGVSYVPGSGGATAQIKATIDALGDLARIADASDATLAKVGGILSGSLANGGKLTAQAFQQIVDVSPQMAAGIAKAFSGQTIVQFMNSLATTDVTFTKLLQAMSSAEPLLRQQAESTVPGMTRAWDDLKASFEKLAQSGGTSGIAGMLESIKTELDQVSAGTKSWGGVLLDADMYLVRLKDDLQNWAAVSILRGITEAWNSLRAAMSNLPSIPASALAPGATPTSTPGGLGGYNNPFTGPQQLSPSDTQPLDTPQDLGPSFNTAFASGTDQVIPPGFDNDTFTAHISSGERLIVVPKGKSLSDMIGGVSAIRVGKDLGRFAAGGDVTAGGLNVDAAITPQGGAIMSLFTHLSDTLSQLGMSYDSTKQTISSAGDGKTNDVIKLQTIQLAEAITLGDNQIVNTLNGGFSAVVNAVGGLASVVSASASSNSSSSVSSSSSVAASSGGGGGGIRSAPGGGINGSDPLGLSATEKGLGWTIVPPSNAVAPATAAPRPYVDPGTPSAILSGQRVTNDNPTSQLPSSGSSIKVAMNQYDPEDYGGSGGAADYAFAGGADFDVPSGYDNDRFRMRVQSGEHVSVTPKGRSLGGANGGGKNVTVNAPITVIVQSLADSPAQIQTKMANAIRTASVHAG